jgi:TRAP-type C4-dicarboxylate transport system substrate-binding protein
MRKHLFFDFLILFVGLVLMASIPVTTQAKTFRLTYSTFFSPSHSQSKLAEDWCREVEKRTEGRVKIDYYPGETLTKAEQCYDSTVEGICDISFSLMAYTRGRFPITAVVDLPLGYPSGTVATRVINDFYHRYQPKELQDTQMMYLHAHGPGLIHCKVKPIKKLEDMRGLKFRAHGTSARVVKALGGTPVPVAMPEAYQMLQKGVVDGAAYPLEANKGWKLGEVTKYATAAFSAAYTSSFFVVMNKDTWMTLPTDIQKIIEEINKEWVIKHGEDWDAIDREGKEFFLSKGGQMIEIDEEESARWKEAVAPIIEEYAEELTQKGFDGKEIVESAMKILDSLK